MSAAVAERIAIDPGSLEGLNAEVVPLKAQERVAWALEHLPETHILSSSFGAQAAVMLHLVTRIAPRIPVVLLDTGYLFPETYQFIDALTTRLDLNLKVYRSDVSAAWQEARFGKEWEQGLAGIEAYNKRNKLEPMQRALRELGANTWISGLRRGQSRSRANINPVDFRDGRWRLHPVFDWNDRDIFRYLKANDLPYHPLWDKGYVSIGDWHTTRPLHEVNSEEETRFFGLKRECGIHDLPEGL
jgi:phosphoadenosine phosphosulfate reductase